MATTAVNQINNNGRITIRPFALYLSRGGYSVLLVITAAEKSINDSYITKEKAKVIALDHAGVKETDAYGLSVEFERDDGVASSDSEDAFNVG